MSRIGKKPIAIPKGVTVKADASGVDVKGPKGQMKQALPPGIVAAAILVFIEAMGAFITPQLLGGPSDKMIAMLVQQRFLAAYDWPLGSAVAVTYLVFTGLLMWGFSAVRRVMLARTVGMVR